MMKRTGRPPLERSNPVSMSCCVAPCSAQVPGLTLASWLTAAGNEATAFGVLLDAEVDTTVAYSDISVTGSVARAASFRGPALIVSVGINAATLADTLRENGIFGEGPITVPTA
jgi:hypothetical protein